MHEHQFVDGLHLRQVKTALDFANKGDSELVASNRVLR